MKQNNRVRKRKKRDGKEKKKEGFSRAHEFLQSKETVPAKYVAAICGCWILAITQAECTFAKRHRSYKMKLDIHKLLGKGHKKTGNSHHTIQLVV